VKDVKVQSFAIPGYSSFPFCVQVCLFSATMAPEILDMTSKFMRNAVRILYHLSICYMALPLLASGLPNSVRFVARAASLCDFGAPGWGEPWFPLSVVLVPFLTEFVYGGFCDCCLFCFVWFDRHSNP
jgi:hypothetical protein